MVVELLSREIVEIRFGIGDPGGLRISKWWLRSEGRKPVIGQF
jgi:hypothetical protein